MIATLRSLLAGLACCLALPALAAFNDNGDGTITDNVTGLMWDKCSWGQRSNTYCDGGAASAHDWPGALRTAVSANGVAHRGYNDWRLPSKNELESLVDVAPMAPAIFDGTAFPNTPSSYYWTSTTYAPDLTVAWRISFADGWINANLKSFNGHYVRLVRGGPSFGSFDSMPEPVLSVSSVGVSGTTSTGTALSATSSLAATGYWIVVARGATAPSAAQVKAGTDYGAVSKVASGSAAMTSTVAKTFSVAGLSANTRYDLYFIAEDGSGNPGVTIRVPFNNLPIFSAQPAGGPLNDTGIDFCRDPVTCADTPVTTTTTCTAAHGGQDARYGRDPGWARGATAKLGGGSKGFDFTKIANDGTALAADAALGDTLDDWACTYDNTTGLMWEVKTASGLRSQAHTYTWYDSVHNYGGNAGTASGGTCQNAGRCDTEKFVADVNAVGLCNHHDWRMPTRNELHNLTHKGIASPGPTIDATYFPNTPAETFWSGSPFAGSTFYAWAAYFGTTSAFGTDKGISNRVRLVRAGQ